MNSLYDFIVEPIGERYNNTIEVDNLKLILNTKIESFKFVNKTAKVISTPLAYKTVIKPGDHVIIHHNVFRRYYDIRGKEKNSSKYFKDNLYFCQPDQIYMYKKQNKWESFMDRCFVKPILNRDNLTLDKTKSLVGILKYGNPVLESLGFNIGDLVGFTPDSEYEFIVENERLYRITTESIIIKYEYKGNEVEYNPSWAKGS